MYSIHNGQIVFVVSGSPPPNEAFENIVVELRKLTGPLGNVSVENIDRLIMGM